MESFSGAAVGVIGDVNVGNRQITGVAGGNQPTDAVNVRQLQVVDDRVTTTNNNLATTNSNLATTNNNLATTNTNLGNLTNSINNGTIGLVQQTGGAPGSGQITVGAGTGGNSVSVAGTAGSRTITGVAPGAVTTTSTDAVNGSQLKAVSDLASNAVQYDGANKGSVTLQGPGGTTITNLKAGALSPTSTDAVNGSQLYTTNQNVTNITNGTAGLVQQIGGSPGVGQLTVGAATGGTSVSMAGTSGSRTVTGVAPGALNATSTEVVNGSQLFATNQTLNNITNGGGIKYFHANSVLADSQANGNNSVAIGPNAVSSYADSVAIGYNSITGAAAPTGAGYATGSAAPTSEVSIGGLNFSRRLTNVSAGSAATDGVNVSQLRAVGNQMNTVIGQTVFDPTTGLPVAPSFTVQGNQYGNVTTALGAVDAGLTTNKTDITNLTQGVTGIVRQDPLTGLITIGGQTGGTVINITNGTGQTRTITGVTAGALNPTSTDAVNGAQLNTTNTNVTNLATSVNNGAIGPVQYSSLGSLTTPNGGTKTNDVTLVGAAAGPVGLHNVANGSTAENSKDAINGGQLNTGLTSVANNFGGGSTYNPGSGTVTAPAYTITRVAPNGTTTTTTYNNVGDALGAVDNSVNSINNTVNNITNGGGIKYFHANSTKADSQAIGVDSVATGPQSVAAGDRAMASGSNAQASANDSVALGSSALASGVGAIAIGLNSKSTGLNTVAIGTGSVATNSVAVGAFAQAGNGGAAFGDNAAAIAPLQGTALGNTASVTVDRGVALGAQSVADRTGMNGTKEAISNAAVASTFGAVSVGSAGNERQITNVAGGTQATDAVNLRQLQSVQAGSVNYVKNTDGTVNYSNVVLGNGQAPGGTTVSNVAPGVAGTDAVNVNQLNGLQTDTGIKLGQLGSDIDRVDKDASAGTAAAMAMASMPQAFIPGKSMVGAGVSGYRGQGALAIGLSTLSDNGRWVYKLNGSVATRGRVGVAAGVGFHW